VRAPALSEVAASATGSDAELVARVRSGDPGAKKRLYVKHVDYIAGMCARLLRSVETSEDVVQDTFVIAFSKIESLRDPGAFRGWLASIAISEVRHRLARQRLLQFLGLDDGRDGSPLDDLARDDLSIEARSELAALDLILRRLPANQRIAWMLRHVEGEPIDVVADACRCSRATVKRWIAAADARVQEYVAIRREEGPL
jgi:RNA polymerase sigma-70 factor (ECF subfamily)